MPDHTTEQELRDRLTLIERMISEGRRHTQSWGWTFILWGIAYYVALAWSAWFPSVWAWPITMLLAVGITVVVASLKAGDHPATTLSRSIGSVWLAFGISIFLLFLGLGLSGRLSDQHVFMAVMSAALGMANGASALILRWKVQLACAVAWWVTAALCCFGSRTQSTMVFLIAIFLCQIVFGIYGVIAEAQTRRRRVQIQARFA